MTKNIRKHFHDQGKTCEDLGSPFTARLCHALAEGLSGETKTVEAILAWPGNPFDDNLAARLCGGLHALVLSEADPRLRAAYPPNIVDDAALLDAVMGAIGEHDERLVAGLATAPQTNEPARSAMLLPGFLAIARETGLPLSINEIGSSAGLNLLWDKYHYDFNGQQWGDPASIIRFSPEMRGSGFPLDVDVEIVSRRGSDIAPIPIEDKDALLRLRSYVWADQKERMERLTAALGLAEAASLAIAKADAADWIEGRLQSRKDGEAFVLFHSIVWQYLPHQTKRRIESMFEQEGSLATSVAPIAWLRMEAADKEHAALSLTCWPAGITRQLANVSYHGGWIELLA